MEDTSVLLALGPTVDGNFLTEKPSDLIKKGAFNNANIMSGYNANEGTMGFVFMYPNTTEKPHLNFTEYEQIMMMSRISPFLQPLQRSALELVYFDDEMIANPNANYFDAVSNILGDFNFACTNDVYLNGAYEAASVVSTYAYYYNHHPSFSLIHAPWSGACHGDDMMFFGYQFTSNHSFTDVEADMSMKMIQYWSNFAKTG